MTATTPSRREFLTVDEVSTLIGFHPKTILRWARTGKIPGALRIQRNWRFRRSTVVTWGRMTLEDISRLSDS